MTRKTFTLFDPALALPAVADAFRKLNPAVQWRNPVMFVVYVGSILTTILWLQALGGQGEARVVENRLHPDHRHLVVVYRPLRQFRRGAGRRAQQGTGRFAARPEEGNLGQEVDRTEA
jgi:hypothetical protein